VTVPDTYAESHIGNTATKPGAAAQKTAQNKIDKYSKLASTPIFYPFAIETAGTWHEMAIELTQEIGSRITTITEDTQDKHNRPRCDSNLGPLTLQSDALTTGPLRPV